MKDMEFGKVIQEKGGSGVYDYVKNFSRFLLLLNPAKPVSIHFQQHLYNLSNRSSIRK